ncbi:MAG: hypothetical protein JNK58_10120 [Phycisphaerae bacterium]|nr:hypothetical protein [Phycisphaerae bacterium]
MRQTSRLSLLAGAVVGISGSALAESGQAWSNADEVRALVSEMSADAETRSSLLQSGGTSGHDGRHFFLGSADGNFRLEVSGQIQFRYYLNFRDDNDNNGDGLSEDDFESGFQTRRTKLFFEGHAFDPNLFYRLSGNFYDDTSGAGGGDGDLKLEDAFAGYRWDNGFSFMWGQFKLPFMREELVSSAYQLAAERSGTNDIYSQGRSQGIQLGYESEDFRLAVAFSDGFNSENSEFSSPRGITVTGFPNSGEADYAFTARGEIKFAGNWDQFQDFTSMPGSDYAVMLGIAGHLEGGDSSSSAFTGGDYNFYGWTADISVEGDGWNFFIAGVGEYSDYADADLNGDGVSEGDVNFGDYGLVAQFGIFIPDTDWEPFLRYDLTAPDTDERNLNSDAEYFNTLTFGVNYYMYGHASKFTADVVWYIDAVGDNALGGVPNTGSGYLTDDDENELAFRLQWQLLF